MVDIEEETNETISVDYKVSVTTDDGLERLSAIISNNESEFPIDEVELVKKGVADSVIQTIQGEWNRIKEEIGVITNLTVDLLAFATNGMIDEDGDENVIITATSLLDSNATKHSYNDLTSEFVSSETLGNYVELDNLTTLIASYIDDEGETGNERINTIASTLSTDNNKLAIISDEDDTHSADSKSYFLKINELIAIFNELAPLLDEDIPEIDELIPSNS